MNLDQAILGLSNLGYIKADVTIDDDGRWINKDPLEKGSFFFVDDDASADEYEVQQITIVLNQVIDGRDLSAWSLVLSAFHGEIKNYFFVEDEVDNDYFFDDVKPPESIADIALLIEKFRNEAIKTIKEWEVNSANN